jgi:hypothetical protein
MTDYLDQIEFWRRLEPRLAELEESDRATIMGGSNLTHEEYKYALGQHHRLKTLKEIAAEVAKEMFSEVWRRTEIAGFNTSH